MESRLFAGLQSSVSAMSAERLRITVASENLANAGATRRLADGLPYARQRVRFDAVLDDHGRATGAVAAEVVESPRYRQIHDPSHPDADPETGIVLEADIDPVLELTDLMVASRAYEANGNAARGMLRMHENALRLGE